ncbi:MAG: flagellin, partial [Eubacterium sp.]|nr:flagellin [Eubacterium sp.]
TYGVLQNRIDYLNSNNRNASINSQASESRMRDADMAAEMMDYTKHKLLADASSSMLAQANQLPKRLINLLTQ